VRVQVTATLAKRDYQILQLKRNFEESDGKREEAEKQLSASKSGTTTA